MELLHFALARQYTCRTYNPFFEVSHLSEQKVLIFSDGFGVENILSHGKLSVVLNFKTPEGIEAFRKLSSTSDVVIDPFRPGVMEKFKLGPDDLMKTNDKLIYARLTGYGLDGPMAKTAGHDINFASMSGLLSFLGGRSEAPTPPINLMGDFAGGGLMAALGITMALHDRQNSGQGQVVDCSMTRGAAYVSSWLFRGLNTYLFCNKRGENLLDGGTFYYDTYKTKDGKWMAVGALEPKFFQNLLKGLNIDEKDLPQTTDGQEGRLMLTAAFARHDQAHWIKVFSDLDACVTPVLSPSEAAMDEHSQHQNNFEYLPDGTLAPKPEPRLSRTPAIRDGKLNPPRRGEHTIPVLKSVGFTDDSLREMIEKGAISSSDTNSNL